MPSKIKSEGERNLLDGFTHIWNGENERVRQNKVENKLYKSDCKIKNARSTREKLKTEEKRGASRLCLRTMGASLMGVV